MFLYRELAVCLAVALLCLVPTSRYVGRRRRGIEAVGLLTLLIAFLLPSGRWQAVPVIAAALILGLTIGLAARAVSLPRPRLYALGRFSALALAMLSAVLCVLLPVFELPRPPGPYAVGTNAYLWVDTARNDPMQNPPAPRELMVQFWYPAEPEAKAKPGPYLLHADRVGPALIKARAPFLPGFLLSQLRYVRARSYPAAPISDDRPAYPLILFCHGYGGIRTQNTALVEHLASFGYIVVAVEFTHTAALSIFPDGRAYPFRNVLGAGPGGPTGETAQMTGEELISLWTDDVRFVVDELERANLGELESPFEGKLDLARIGVLGHSFGGATSANLCRVDPRFAAGMNLDGYLNEANVDLPLQAPFAFFMAGSYLMTAEELEKRGIPRQWAERISKGRASIRAAIESAQRDTYLLVMKGSRHETFTDMPLYSPFAGAFGMGSEVPAERSTELLCAYTRAFFDTHLSGERSELMEGPYAGYPEIVFEKKPAPVVSNAVEALEGVVGG
ncbi:MAG: carboxylic ester hydrolase [Candidatus Hydrogenedentota bacterium]